MAMPTCLSSQEKESGRAGGGSPPPQDSWLSSAEPLWLGGCLLGPHGVSVQAGFPGRWACLSPIRHPLWSNVTARDPHRVWFSLAGTRELHLSFAHNVAKEVQRPSNSKAVWKESWALPPGRVGGRLFSVECEGRTALFLVC